MLGCAISAVVLGGAFAGQAAPDQVHLLRSADGRPNIELVMDTSGSMAWGGPTETSQAAPSSCTGYWTSCNAAGKCSAGSKVDAQNVLRLVKTDQLKAVLTGCQSPTDGIVDKWAGRVQFSLREFGGDRTNLLADFGSSSPALESQVLELKAVGGTPLTPAHALAARHFHTGLRAHPNALQTETLDCRQNYIVMLTDGDGNSMHNFQAYNWECTLPPGDPRHVDATEVSAASPALGAAYVYRREASAPLSDNICDPDLPSAQFIGTYTIGFHTGAAAETVLTNVAQQGGGQYYASSSYESLDNAFNNIITSIVGRSAVNFQGGIVAPEGMLQGNWIYVSPWTPSSPGRWLGNTRKHQLLPFDAAGQYTSARTDTFFVLSNGTLVVNPNPIDVWTGQSGGAARVGGSAGVITNQRGYVGGPPPASPYGRNIKTWKPNRPFSDYLAFDGSSSGLTPDDTWSSSFCEHMKLINYTHGYVYDVRDCGACGAWGDAGCAPVANDWPIGASIDSTTVLIKYAADCETSAGQCFVVAGTAAGTLEIYDAYDGRERAAIVPGEILSPLGPTSVTPVANDYLRYIPNQPTLDAPVRFFVDGGVRLFHDDENGNGYIDGTESANLVFSLGRGGRGLMLIPVRAGFDGDPAVARGNPVRVLAPYDEPSGSAFTHLQDIWASPSVSELRDPITGTTRLAIAFGSGHMKSLDFEKARMGGALPLASQPRPHVTAFIPGGAASTGCAALTAANGFSPVVCDPIDFLESVHNVSLTPCSPCNDPSGSSCGSPPYCYDWPGLSSFGISTPHVFTAGPLVWRDANGDKAVAFRFHVDRLDLQSGDCLHIQTGDKRTVQSLCGSGGSQWSQWVYDERVHLQFVSDGNDSAPSSGFVISDVEVVLEPPALGACVPCDADGDGDCDGPEGGLGIACDVDGDGACHGVECGPSLPTTPGIYVMDLETWSDTGNPRDALLMRFTKDCGTAPRWPSELCYDSSVPGNSDLGAMIFPISAEVARYEEGGILRAWYVGDEGGQVWKIYFDASANDWRARRLAHFNNDGVVGASKDFRKIFTKLEVVPSSCNGSRSVGLYGGTGNIQRASAFDNLGNTAIAPPQEEPDSRDLLFVVWDSAKLPQSGTSLDRMLNVTNQARIVDPANSAAEGYYIELLNDEKMLRNPLVFNGVAFFKTYQPTVAASECISASGQDRVYAFDNCTAEAVVNSNPSSPKGEIQDRLVFSGATDIGNPLQLFAPKGQAPFVSVMDQNTTGASAALPSKPFRRGLGLVLFRLL